MGTSPIPPIRNPQPPEARVSPHPDPAPPADPIPNPEPASPSLSDPDPGIFHPEIPPQHSKQTASSSRSNPLAGDPRYNC
jgi:hypothetical protein